MVDEKVDVADIKGCAEGIESTDERCCAFSRKMLSKSDEQEKEIERKLLTKLNFALDAIKNFCSGMTDAKINEFLEYMESDGFRKRHKSG